MARKVALLLWAQTLGLAGAQTTQLLVEPPWRPAVLWDQVTLTCQGSGTASATTWYKDMWRWGPKGPDHFTVTESGTYHCDRPGSGLSPPMTVSDDDLVLQVPVPALLEGDMVTLRCRGWWDKSVTSVSFYHDEKKVWELRDGTELSLSNLQLQHSGRYRCEGLVQSWFSVRSSVSSPVTVTVHELFSVPVLEGPPELTEGSPLTLICLSTPSLLRPQAPLLYVFYRDRQVVGGPQWSPQLLVPTVGISHSGNYSCQVRSEGVALRKSSSQLRVTVHIAVNVGRTLLFLLLLLAVIGGCHWWHHRGAPQRRSRCWTLVSWAPSTQGMSTGSDRVTSPMGVASHLGPHNRCLSQGPHRCPPALPHLGIHK
ncbi:Fc receptor-like protein 3 isoform X6 [Haemorhous mexicanus]|uniref:Fc receptor-like protein 3 isoform X6 n=1 Tax=Haemorhous mexicanus TaxID=30427 RepID=UPI0028BD9969|nr:Fc receptor-like protein 3 isoform X6 [Haemorhous mexicanus]